MDFIQNITEGRPLNLKALRSILDESLKEEDFFVHNGCRLLSNAGLEKNEALMLLAQYKSKIKYGYDLSISSLSHILRVSKKDKKETPLKRLAESPFFLIKACWLYDHAPNFYFFNGYKPKDLDDLIIKFAKEYETRFLNNKVSIDNWKKVKKPRRVLASSFWEKDIIDPILFIEKVINQNIEGIEISFDFHPFNYTKLLPEELSKKKREQINEARRKSGIKIDIHGPIVGPYFPLPIPRKGRQLFNNPLRCFGLQCETIELAKDIGAGSVVVHLIDSSDPKKMSDLIMQAGGSNTRVTIENYCQTKELQNSDNFLAYLDEIIKILPKEVIRNNFGVTLDVGHLNIEGEDPLVASDKIGSWCHDNGVYIRIHATDNYGNLPFTPPSYSADIHNNVSGLGINNEAIIKLLRSKGLRFDVVAEQIKPLTPEDISIIHKAQSIPLEKSYDDFLSRGKEILTNSRFEELITPSVMKENPYLFLAGLEGTDALKEYLVYRKIQDRKYLFVDDAKKISQDFMKMPQKIKNHLIRYLDDLLLPIQDEKGTVSKNQLGLICQNISGALFGTINNEHLSQIFSQSRTYKKGNVICRQNTIGHEMYFIEEGEANIFVKGSMISSLGPGEIFGEISLFYNIKRTATIRAAKDNTKVRILSRKNFMNLIRRDQPYSYDLIYRLYHILPERLRNLIDKYKASVDSIHLILDREEGIETSVEEVPLDMGLKTDIIPPFSQEEAEMLFKQKKEFDADQVIFSEGEEGDRVFYILEGKVKVVTRSSTNKEIKYGELGEGEVFGEMALMDNKTRSASIVTITPCKMSYIEKNDFIDLLDTRSELAFRLLAYTCVSILERILRLDKVYTEIKNWVENYKRLRTNWIPS